MEAGDRDVHGRVPLQARVSEEAKRGWDHFSAQWGVSVTSLLEVLGRRMDNGDLASPSDWPEEHLEWRKGVIHEARLITFERRVRH